MCIAVPGQIKEILDSVALVNIMDVETLINVQLLHKPKVGDYVLIHAGCAIEKVDADYYEELRIVIETYVMGDVR